MSAGLRLAILMTFTMFGAARAADKPRVGPAEAWVLPSPPLPSPTPEAAGAAGAMLLEDAQVRFDGEGVSRFSELEMKVQTAEGLTAMGTIAVPWAPTTDVLTIHRINIIRGSTIIDCLPKDGVFNVIRRESKLESQATLDGILTAVIRPEGLQIGDILDIAMTMRRDDPLQAGAFDETLVGFDLLPLSHLRLRAAWPTASGTQYQATGGLEGMTVTKTGAETTLSVETEGMQPLARPKDAPARFQHGRMLQLSNYATWADVSAKLQPLYVEAAKIQPAGPLADEVKAIAARTADPTQRTLAALILVEDKVRYFEQAIGDGGLRPASADLTWLRRWGDCKAKTVLLVGLLHALGVAAEPVYVSVAHGDGLDERLPSLGVFNHVLVSATVGGRSYWLDGTRIGDTSLAALRTPGLSWGLPIRARGAVLIPMRAAAFTEPQAITRLQLDAGAGLNVSAKAHLEFLVRGDGAKFIHSTLGNLAGEALDRDLRSYWTGRFDFITPSKVSAKFEGATGEETLLLDGTAKLDWDGGYEADGAVLGWKLNTRREPGPHADAPYAIAYPMFDETDETILLPRGGVGFKVSGDNIDKDLAGHHFHRRAWIEGGAFHLEASAKSLVPEINLAEAHAAVAPMAVLAKSTIRVKKPDDYAWTSADLDAAMKSEPTDVDGYMARARALMNAGRGTEARNDLNKAVALGAPPAELLALRGMVEVQLDEPAATADFARAEALDAKQIIIWRGRGELAEKNKLWADAVTAYRKGLDLRGDDGFSLARLTTVYVEMGDEPNALATSDKAADARAFDKNKHLARARIYMKFKDVAMARQEVALVEVEGKDDGERNLARAALMGGIGDREGALAAVDAEIARAPSAAAWLSHARYREPDDAKGMVADASAALKLDPANERTLLLLGFYEAKLHDYVASDQALESALKLTPKSAYLVTLMAENAAHAGKSTAEVAAIYARARGFAIGSAALLNNLCYSEATMDGVFDQALADCDASLEIEGNSAATLDSRGFTLLRLGRNAEAIKDFDSALARRPFAATLLGRSLAEARLGQTEASKRDRADAVALEPKIADHFAEWGVTQ